MWINSGQWYVRMWLLGDLFKGCQAVGKGSFCPLLLPASCLECKHYGWSSGSHPAPWGNVKNRSFWSHQGSTIPALNCLFPMMMMMMMIIFYQWEKYTMYLFIVNAILKWYNKCFWNISIVQIHLRPLLNIIPIFIPLGLKRCPELCILNKHLIPHQEKCCFKGEVNMTPQV